MGTHHNFSSFMQTYRTCTTSLQQWKQQGVASPLELETLKAAQLAVRSLIVRSRAGGLQALTEDHTRIAFGLYVREFVLPVFWLTLPPSIALSISAYIGAYAMPDDQIRDVLRQVAGGALLHVFIDDLYVHLSMMTIDQQHLNELWLMTSRLIRMAAERPNRVRRPQTNDEPALFKLAFRLIADHKSMVESTTWKTNLLYAMGIGMFTAALVLEDVVLCCADSNGPSRRLVWVLFLSFVSDGIVLAYQRRQEGSIVAREWLVALIMTLDNGLEGFGISLEFEDSNVSSRYAFVWLSLAVILGGQLTMALRWITIDAAIWAPFVHASLSYFAVGLLFASTLRQTQTSSFIWTWIGFTTAWIISRVLHMFKHYFEHREVTTPRVANSHPSKVSQYPYMSLSVQSTPSL